MSLKDFINSVIKREGAPPMFDRREVENLCSDGEEGPKNHKILCVSRNRLVNAKPEEIIRQLFARRLINRYGYDAERIKVEHSIRFGREEKRADIVVCDQEGQSRPYIIVELKAPGHFISGKEQLKSYCNASGAIIGVLTDGLEISYYHHLQGLFIPLPEIPKEGQEINDVTSSRFTIRDLIMKDRIACERKSLKSIILEMENEVLANAGVDVFEEVFKLIFAKLYDEYLSGSDKEKLLHTLSLRPEYRKGLPGSFELLTKELQKMPDESFRELEFRNTGIKDTSLKKRITSLFNNAKERWGGIFPEDSKIELTGRHLSVCVSSIQDIKLLNSNLQIVDEAFEYLVNKSAKGEKGQYFTPRHVIDMCVRMLNPKPGEYMIDPASGSCGFPIHTIFQITGHFLSDQEISRQEKRNVLKIFGIDFDEKTVRVARTINLIAGDGETNVLYLNALDYDSWDERAGDATWSPKYIKGYDRLRKLRQRPGQNKNYQFDLVMANPPFAGDIKEAPLLNQYELGTGKKSVGRDILFVERNLDLLKPGGRMAIVLPQGRFNNPSDSTLRDFIAEQARIIAVVDLHPSTFKPHTGVKTSVLFLQKWDDDLCPVAKNYPVFFGVSRRGGKNNSGNYIYAKGADNEMKLDQHGHLIVEHDLYKQTDEMPDGIAEKFIEWAKEQKLGFWID
ncbi:MAG: N-6 DNA methylase [Gammaproteobacteria bacterium AqS3]|nr:N-6 DNA methylase [Gammaproteobacteria bacterium AqS3]